MIDVFATEVQAVDEDNNLLFIIKREDTHCCTMTMTKNLLLDSGNVEETLDAVRRGVKMLGIKQ